jgi:hypothetical protein
MRFYTDLKIMLQEPHCTQTGGLKSWRKGQKECRAEVAEIGGLTELVLSE